jgi:hypothetical protein
MKLLKIMKLRNIALSLTLIFGSFGLASSQCTYQNACQPDGDEIGCPNGMNNCCQTDNACNGPNSPIGAAWNYDPDYSGTGGCDLSCAPIDSGVLFLLIGGGLFGGFMIKRRRETELMPLAAK